MIGNETILGGRWNSLRMRRSTRLIQVEEGPNNYKLSRKVKADS